MSDSATSWVCHTASRSAVRAKARVMPRARSSLTRPSLMIRATRLSAWVSASVNIASSSPTFWKPIACQNRRAVTGSTPAPSDTSRRPIEAGRPSSDPLDHVVRARHVPESSSGARCACRPGPAGPLGGHIAASPSPRTSRRRRGDVDHVAGGHGSHAPGGAHGQSARIVDACRDTVTHRSARLVHLDLTAHRRAGRDVGASAPARRARCPRRAPGRGARGRP